MIKKDAILIGSGQANVPFAKKLSEAGWKIVMIEKSVEKLGGVCLNVGCTPTKTLIASAKVMHDIKVAGKHGISVSDLDINFKKTQQRKDAIVEEGKKGMIKRMGEVKNLEIVYGKGSFKDKNTVIVKMENGKEKEFSAPYIFIDAGARPAIPKIKNLDKIKYYDSTGILELKEIPKKLIVVGGGYIGLELGQMYSRFGSKVTILDNSSTIMSHEDEDVTKPLQEILEKEGMNFILNSFVEKVSENGKNVSVTYKIKGKEHSITGSHLLVVTGRISNADTLNTKAAGIKLDEKGFIKVNSKLETNVKNIFAMGDINGGPQFTHISYNDFVIMTENILHKGKRTTKGRIVPYTMFTDPQVGRVGLSENQAKKQKLDYSVIKIAGERITRGKETAQTQGPWKAVIDNKSGQILGASIVCTEGGEIATVLQMAMLGKIPADYFPTGIFAHPTYSESLNTLFSQIYTLNKNKNFLKKTFK
ncbi:mercuric reductase [Halpernia frigidisoli]|uniref:Pyruvate/2-oxoglutarate dehydrogenase complex, dihydrolipoamide dehydrogenase (E3) component n=1 Tax=Halpernia frigidisoli TaxID=1125876 RepID=A0A1I3HQ62_9FLAO|nr:mercuric reductase [Halpernia frigidisoli]SFI37918.1 Pyruvate/2-oxoglutarate dehydrogenase complex, dihydrolipoamide dehydrogenase (E3) component [Halpernia frigidisoli]